MTAQDDPRAAKFSKYGWTCSETNLATLPASAPVGAKNLTEWLTLEGRRSSLVEWINHVAADGRIHGRFTNIGAWTGRMAHSAPNQANIPSAFTAEVRSTVDQVKKEYDGRLRGLWGVEPGNYLVGTDAEGIQLRILAHLMRSEEYIKAIVSGRKEDETDIHNVNKRALGLPHVTRDMAKTFIYAFLLGAGQGKIAEILGVNLRTAATAIDNFTNSIQGLAKLKTEFIPHVAARGWFKGVDGRKVKVPSEHKTLAGMLQNGEAVIMKHAALDWTAKARSEGIKFKLVTWPHDEWQTEVCGNKDTAERLGEIQRQSIVDTGVKFGILCPLAGSTALGRNWRDTH